MKKLKVYISSIVAFLCGMGTLDACWLGNPWGCDVSRYEFCIYKVPDGDVTDYSAERMKERNIGLWQRQTGLSRQTIVQLVYPSQSDLVEEGEVRALLGHDSVACKLVLMARQCEVQRNKLSSAWYYALEEDEPHMILDQIAREAEAAAAKPGRMRDRFILLAIRARFALRQYAECLAIWDNYGASVKGGVIRDYILPYVAGCYYHRHQPQLAIPIYLRYGDVSSLKFCYRMLEEKEVDENNYESSDCQILPLWFSHFERTEYFRLMAEHCPDVPDLGNKLQPFLSNLCVKEYDDDWAVTQLQNYRKSAVKAAGKCGLENRALWYYSAAAISDVLGEARETQRWIDKVRRCQPNEELERYCTLLEYHTYFTHSRMDSVYQEKVAQFIRWVDEQMVSSFRRNHISLYLESNYYACYASRTPRDEAEFWNFALRKVVFQDICNRYCSRRQYEEMLKLANYAENRYLHLCHGARLWQYDLYGWDGLQQPVLTDVRFDYGKYVRVDEEWNSNYSTELFTMADSIPAFVLGRYVSWLAAPVTNFDSLLVAGSNTDMSYWNEMLGTHYLREQNYVCAKRALSRVSKSFQHSMNVTFDRDPFTTEYLEDIPQCKLHFAEEMVRLEQKIRQSRKDDKAEYMLRYALGMANSADLWMMTSYQDHAWWSAPYCWKKTYYKELLREKADRLREEALTLFVDRERKAKALLALHRRQEIMRDFSETSTAHYLIRHCDLWRDYAEQHKIPFVVNR